eukprot:COSAG06_NODE_53321_length_300_cov_2.049751_1_plen_37_part_01
MIRLALKISDSTVQFEYQAIEPCQVPSHQVEGDKNVI